MRPESEGSGRCKSAEIIQGGRHANKVENGNSEKLKDTSMRVTLALDSAGSSGYG